MEILIVFVLILLNGVFSMTEIALVSVNKPRLETAAKKGNSRAKIALKLANAPEEFLSTVQIGITLISILTGIYSGEAITNKLEAFLASYAFLSPYADGLAVVIVVILITFFTLVLGELVPKRIGLSNPEAIAKLMSAPMLGVSKVTAPFVWLLTLTSDMVLRVFNIKPAEIKVTEDEIRALVEEGARGGIVQGVEQNIVDRVFYLGDRHISALMTYRTEVVSIDISADAQKVRSVLNDTLYSVYPVVEGNLDKLVGVVYLKDMFKHLNEPDFKLASYVKPPVHVFETTSAYKTLEIFKNTGVHYSLVTDEYGSVMGLVTMNDILDALVGDSLEAGGDDSGIQEREDGSWLIDGDYPFHDFLHFFDLPSDIEPHHFDTLGGLILHRLGYIPKAGDKIVWMELVLEVVDMDRTKIDKVLVKRV